MKQFAIYKLYASIMESYPNHLISSSTRENEIIPSEKELLYELELRDRDNLLDHFSITVEYDDRSKEEVMFEAYQLMVAMIFKKKFGHWPHNYSR